MGQELQLPDWAKGAMAQAFAVLPLEDDNLADGIGQSYAVIGYKGKTWSLRYRGERKHILNPADGTPSGHLDVIILGQAKSKSKSYYKKYDPNQSDGDRPICASIDGIRPDPDVTTKQCDNCALCPKNEWKADPATGRKGRECTDYKRLAVLILPTMTKPILGQALMEPAFLRVPPDSLNSLAIMGETMNSQGFHYTSYITRIVFDPNKAHPCMMFRPLQGLTDQEAPVILELRRHAGVERIIGAASAVGLKAVETALAPPLVPAPSTVAPATSPAPTGVSSVVVPLAPASSPAITPVASGLSVAPSAAPPATPPVASPISTTSPSTTNPTGLVDTGFGGANGASAAPPPQAAVQTVADVGAPEESSDELDARIASMIKVA